MSGYQRVSAASANNTTTPKTISVNCPAGKKVTGGGGSVTNSDDVGLTQSFPADDDTWTAKGADLDGFGSATWTLTVYAVCVTAL